MQFPKLEAGGYKSSAQEGVVGGPVGQVLLQPLLSEPESAWLRLCFRNKTEPSIALIFITSSFMNSAGIVLIYLVNPICLFLLLPKPPAPPVCTLALT